MRLQGLAVGVAIAGFGVAGWRSVRVGWADYWARQETVAGTRKALAAMPMQPEYQVRLAALLADTDGRGAERALRQAVALNPLDARSWIDLGLRAEARGDLGEAEACLLRAAAADRKYLPRWTLANFYFRRDRAERFWFWAKSAAEMIYGDATPLFRLCGRMGDDGRLMERLEIRNPDVRAAYLSYLVGARRMELIGPVTGQILRESREADVPLLLDTCDHLIEGRRADQAVELWNGLAGTGRIALGSVDPAKGAVLTNGNFAAPPASRCFDWRLAAGPGLETSREENPLGLRLTFSGQEAEQVEALAQFVPVLEGSEYRLVASYRTSGIAAGAGLGWRVTGLDGARLATGESLSSETEAVSRVTFRTPAGCKMVRVSLAYQRAPGTTRIEGFITLRNVAVEWAAPVAPLAERSREK